MLGVSTILTFLQLKGIGSAKAFRLCNYALKEHIELASLVDIRDYLRICIEKGILSKNSYDMLDNVGDAYLKAHNIIERSIEQDIKIVSFYDDLFPEQLRNVINGNGKVATPILLYYKGNLAALPKRGVAIIGTRGPTSKGIVVSEFWGKSIAKKGLNIVSGLAAGCDAYAHIGALKGGGFTTAILAHGLDMVYPLENCRLAQDIIENGGLLLSEYPVGVLPMLNYFVARNRLQSGLADATILIQAGLKGGSWHAINATLKAGKPLFAVAYENDRNNESIQGNLKLIDEKKAIPLTPNGLERVLSVVANAMISLDLHYS